MSNINKVLSSIAIFCLFSCNNENDTPQVIVTSKEVDITTDSIVQTTIEETDSVFVTGLSSYKMYTKEQAEEGSNYEYNDGRKLKIDFFFDQVDVMFYSINENDKKQKINTEFEIGYSSDGEMSSLNENVLFLIGQYDFDGDKMDELVISIKDKNIGSNGISLNVFKLENDTWKAIGIMNGGIINGDPIADVYLNKVTIKRHLHDFYYQWTFESGKFINTGDY